MSKPNILNQRFGVKVNEKLVEKEAERNFETELVDKLVGNINAVENDESCISNNRMATLAQALFESEALSVFDEDYELDRLMKEIYAAKLSAHLEAFKAAVDYLDGAEAYDNSESADFNGLAMFTQTYSVGKEKYYTPEMTCRVLFVENYAEEKPMVAIAVFYVKDKPFKMRSLNVPILSFMNKDSVEKQICEQNSNKTFFDLKFSTSSQGSEMNIRSLDGVKNALNLINQASSGLGCTVNYHFQ